MSHFSSLNPHVLGIIERVKILFNKVYYKSQCFSKRGVLFLSLSKHILVFHVGDEKKFLWVNKRPEPFLEIRISHNILLLARLKSIHTENLSSHSEHHSNHTYTYIFIREC